MAVDHLNPSTLIRPGANGTINSILVASSDPSLINWSTNQTIFPVNGTTLNTCDASSPCAFFGVDRKLKTPYVLNWNINLQQEITPSTALQVGYVANHGVQFYSTIDLNQVNTAIDDGSEQLGRPFTASCAPPVGLGIGNQTCYPYISFLISSATSPRPATTAFRLP